MATEKAIFAAGCFWGVEQAFYETPGVVRTSAGYTGGHAKNPTYEDVCSDSTGHAEAVLVEYDPGRISYGKLLEIFWKIHDPTTPNRQGPDVGSQYRSAIFCRGEKQLSLARKSRDKLAKSGEYSRPIVTEIAPAKKFWPAEDYHQKYFLKHPGAVCHF